MKNLSIKKTILNILFGMVSLSWLAVSNTVVAADTCEKISVHGEIFITGPLIPGPIALGSAFYTFGDGTTAIASVSAILVDPLKVSDEGVIHITLDITHAFPNGDTLNWLVSPVISPTDQPGISTLNERLVLIAGTGSYLDAMGRGTGHGYVSFLDGQIIVDGKGMLCGANL